MLRTNLNRAFDFPHVDTISLSHSENDTNGSTGRLGTVRLVNAIFYAHHGVMQEEHRVGNRYEVDVSMHFNFVEAARTDSLALTVDYAEVYDAVKEVITQNRFYLIERLAYLIGQGVLEVQPKVEQVEVTVRKHNPPVGGTCDRAEAIYRASRSRDLQSDGST